MKSSELHSLIRSLSPAEKRHFKMYGKVQGQSSSYVEVFDAIERQDIYDEKALKEQFKSADFIRQFHVIKNYLQKAVMKSLRSFHSLSSRDAELKDVLRNVEILFFKELYAQAGRELKRADTIASNYELFAGQIEVLNWKRRIQQHLAPHNLDALTAISKEEQNAVIHLQNNLDYMQLIVAISSAVQNESREPVNHEHLLDSDQNALSLDARVMHYNAVYFRSVQSQDTHESEQTLYQLLDYLESKPERLAEDPGYYVSSINNFLSYMVFSGKTSEAFELLTRAKRVYDRVTFASEKRSLLKQMLRTYNIELELYRESGDFKTHRKFIDKLEDFVLQNERKMPPEYLLSFFYQFAYIKFQLKDFKDSLVWVNRIINAKWQQPRVDILMHTRFLNLMIHTELNNMFVLRYYVDNMRRFLKKQSLLNVHEQHLIKLFSALGKAPLLERKDIYNHYLEFSPPVQAASGPRSEDWAAYIDWIRAKAEAPKTNRQ
jgi:hypothetical protein